MPLSHDICKIKVRLKNVGRNSYHTVVLCALLRIGQDYKALFFVVSKVFLQRPFFGCFYFTSTLIILSLAASGSSSKQNGLSDREVLQSSSKSRLKEEGGSSRDHDKSKRESREAYTESRRLSTDKDHSAHWDVDEWLPMDVEGSRSEPERGRDDTNRSSPRERLSSKDLISPKLKRVRIEFIPAHNACVAFGMPWHKGGAL